ncbi:integrase-type DNA-binding superfamily protein [Actinidia rufa]|uniref:Integrase-type DNA-binding superfamily protein n=1 Tax=Actinidia rufa TaxID=165716 RepID=A0A7J0DP05_9ERIC|nr:integrase-type DNA-binding superfamily protein [Actinidia rufa]
MPTSKLGISNSASSSINSSPGAAAATPAVPSRGFPVCFHCSPPSLTRACRAAARCSRISAGDFVSGTGGGRHFGGGVGAEPYTRRLTRLPDLRHPLAAPAPYPPIH